MRTYDIDGNTYPSVTTILNVLDKPALIGWAANMAVEYIKQQIENNPDFAMDIETILEAAKTEYKTVSVEAADIGTEIHDLISIYIKSGQDAIGEMCDEVQNGFLAFLDWEKENIDTWIESELEVFDPINCYAGRLDSIAKMKNGKIYVIDFKSSKGFYPGYDMQCAAYRGAYELMDREKIDGMMVLRLDKLTGLPETKDYSKIYEDKLKAFICLVDYYYASAKRKVKNIRTK